MVDKAPHPQRTDAPAAPGRLSRGGAWALMGVLGLLVLVEVPVLGSDPWPFRTGDVEGRGLLGPLVDAAGGRWDLGFVRSPALLAGLLLVLVAAASWRIRSWRASAAMALSVAVVSLLLFPAVLLQVGLRDATAPWFHTNDSTYQIELAGELIRDGDDPYGADYRFSGLERFYSRNGTVAPGTREREVALRHLAYFPGTPLTAAAWGLLPRPLDDYRVFVALTTLALLFAGLAFRGPLAWRIGLGAVLAANPLAVRAAWFGTADAPSLLLTVLAFALATRSRWVAGAALLGAAVLLKQFALAAVPFFALALGLRAPRELRAKAAAAFLGVVALGTLPFLVADAGALYRDTVAYGADTYRIVGYGLSALLLEAGIIDDRLGPYPFLPLVIALWLPFTVWLLRCQLASRSLWAAAAGFTLSVFLLLYIGRVFQPSYLVWPLAGIAIAAVVAVWERAGSDPATVSAGRGRAP